MRESLRRIGVSEKAFLKACDASFKQGTKFVGWRTGAEGEYYYHPFSLPHGFLEVNTVPCWQERAANQSFAAAVSPQEAICQQALAPKQFATPEFAAVVNYAYHLDAGKFGQFLRDHCVEQLGVRHVSDNVLEVVEDDAGFVAGLVTGQNGMLAGDFFVDCSGGASLLLAKHYGVPRIDRSPVLFNDRALAVQVPYTSPQDPIASATVSTALTCGWVWDIGLPTRRGVGYVYSSSHCSDSEAEVELRGYLSRSVGAELADSIDLRLLRFDPGHLESFWHKNCVAVGMSSGFIEPLEASALALVELSAAMIRDDLPADRSVMEITAARFNDRFRYRWDRVIDFLKLHYVLSQRDDSDYWRDHRNPADLPDRLRELLSIWKFRAPSRLDFFQTEEIFPAASYQYVLYGMGFRTEYGDSRRPNERDDVAIRHFNENSRQTRKMLAGLPPNRDILAQLAQ
jgi:hypothetical protein